MTSLTNESPQAAGAGIVGLFVTVGGALVVVRREDSWAAKQSAIEHASACRAVLGVRAFLGIREVDR